VNPPIFSPRYSIGSEVSYYQIIPLFYIKGIKKNNLSFYTSEIQNTVMPHRIIDCDFIYPPRS